MLFFSSPFILHGPMIHVLTPVAPSCWLKKNVGVGPRVVSMWATTLLEAPLFLFNAGCSNFLLPTHLLFLLNVIRSFVLDGLADCTWVEAAGFFSNSSCTPKDVISYRSMDGGLLDVMLAATML